MRVIPWRAKCGDQRAGSTKHQNPSSKEAPIFKHQISKRRTWSLVFAVSLVLGAWCLVLGIWSLLKEPGNLPMGQRQHVRLFRAVIQGTKSANLLEVTHG